MSLTIRTALFVPGDQPSRIRTALATGVDVVVVDLEDAVAPAAKRAARATVVETLAAAATSVTPAVAVRVNDVGTEWFADDVAALGRVLPLVDLVVLPMAQSADDVRRLDDALTAEEGAHGPAAGETAVVPIVETARGVLEAFELAGTSSRVLTLMFGSADLSNELGVTATPEGQELLHARSHVVLAAAAAGCAPPVDGPYLTLRDPEGLAVSCAAARALGFGGKAAIHPEQLATVTDCFSPTEAELDWARQVEQAHEQARGRGSGVATLTDGTFVDEPVVARARRILAAQGVTAG